MPQSSLDVVLRGMNRPKAGLHYYFLELMAQPDGQIIHYAYTEWVGFSKSSPRREIRKGSLVRPEYFIPKWRDLSIPFVVVNTEQQMMVYLFIGGTALVEKGLAEQYFADDVLPMRGVPGGRPGIQKCPEPACVILLPATASETAHEGSETLSVPWQDFAGGDARMIQIWSCMCITSDHGRPAAA